MQIIKLFIFFILNAFKVFFFLESCTEYFTINHTSGELYAARQLLCPTNSGKILQTIEIKKLTVIFLPSDCRVLKRNYFNFYNIVSKLDNWFYAIIVKLKKCFSNLAESFSSMMHKLTVKVTDFGTPRRLSSSAHVTVTVHPRNNRDPQFDHSSFVTVAVLRSSALKTFVSIFK